MWKQGRNHLFLTALILRNLEAGWTICWCRLKDVLVSQIGKNNPEVRYIRLWNGLSGQMDQENWASALCHESCSEAQQVQEPLWNLLMNKLFHCYILIITSSFCVCVIFIPVGEGGKNGMQSLDKRQLQHCFSLFTTCSVPCVCYIIQQWSLFWRMINSMENLKIF